MQLSSVSSASWPSLPSCGWAIPRDTISSSTCSRGWKYSSQWHQGILYPRWAALAHWGYGEARFLFYPPASWTLGAALGTILPWKMVPAAYCWIALSLAGLSMYQLAREWLSPRDALFAAGFYAVNPYHLLIVYWRSAFAELLAAALLPLLLLAVLRLRDPGFRPVLWLSVILAAAWLTNAPAAVMIHYSVAGLVVRACNSGAQLASPVANCDRDRARCGIGVVLPRPCGL